MTRRLLCKTGDVPIDTVKEFSVDADRAVCVVNAGGSFFACQPTCPHEGVRLCDGCVTDTTLTCLEHLWQWDLATGEPRGLAEASLTTYPVRVDGESVYLDD